MKISFWLSLIASAVIPISGPAQGTFVFDQQSSTDESAGMAIAWRFQSTQPFGQSFVPSLSSIGFVRLFLDIGGPVEPDATVYVNLLSGSITGTVMAATAPLTLNAYFSGRTNLLFPTSVPLTPGTAYYLQPVATAGSPVIDVGAGYTYPNGSLFISGVAQAPTQLWFREGIVVPEPATAAITITGIIALAVRRRRPC